MTAASNTIKPAAVQSSTTNTSSAAAGNTKKKDNKQYYPSNKQDSTTISKPTIKISTSNTNSNNSNNNNSNVQLYTSSNIKLLHQRTSLSLAYDSNVGWNYVGETSLYVIVQQQQQTASTDTTKSNGSTDKDSSSKVNKPLNNGDNRPIELALHLRDSCQVNSINIYGVASYSSQPPAPSEAEISTTSSKKDEDVQMQDVATKDVIEKEVLQTRTRGGISKAISKIDEVTQSTTDQPTSTSSQQQPYVKDPNVNHKLTKLPNHTITYTHHDPLSIVMKRFANLHNVEDDGSSSSQQRYEADAHATRGTKGITNSIRAASVTSSIGELRVSITPNFIKKENKGSRIRLKVGGGRNTPVENKESVDVKMNEEKTDVPQLPQSQIDATQCWKDDLLYNSFSADNNEDTTTTNGGRATGETVQGVMEYKMNKEMIKHRCQDRKKARIDLIAKSMGEATSCKVNGGKGEEENKEGWSLSPAMKIVIRFSLRHPNNIVGQHVNLGGIHFISPSSPTSSNKSILQHASLSTPHVYTTPGTHGDHQGIRSWLPTLDSASPYHRCSHELTIKLTCKENDGLWPCGSGEDFGYNSSVKHPILGNDCSEIIDPLKEKKTNENNDRYQKGVAEVEQVWNAVNDGISNVLGVRHARFINDFFYGDDSGDDVESEPQDMDSQDLVDSSSSEINMEMVQQIRHIQPTYVTSIFSSLTWLPCPSRSLGFAVGPFSTLYDPEYFRLDHDNDDDSDSEIEEDDANDDNGPLSLQETAQKLGEGIRQLYFAPKEDRKWIHSDVTDELIFGYENENENQGSSRPELSTAQLQERRLLEGSVLASTVGVPNRALSLMRDVLALPAYRTSSYTQIWIPNAYMSGDNCGGNMVGCPEVGGCNSFLGGAIMDSTLLPPPGMRLPYYDEGRSLQFLQARNCIRGWTRAALALGGDDDVGQGYLHTLIESFLMSLYERGHGAFGEGGGKGSFFYTKRYAIGSGLNSPNLDFLPLVNIEDDEVIGGSVGVTVTEEGGNEHLWRSANNGTETHTSALDEFAIEQLQAKDFIEAMERATERPVPLPSPGWQGSHQSATFLSHNSASSTALGCGALDFVHPMGGQMYRATKAILLSKVYEGRAGMSNFTRVVRAAFIASFLRDVGVSQLKLPEEEEKGDDKDSQLMERPPFVICVDEMIKKQSISHAIFTRALRVISGPVHEVYLRGNLIDIGRDNYDSKMQRKLVAPEGFPNSYVRGASGLYLRVGAHIESADGSSAQSTPAASQSAAAVKGIHLHVVAEPCIPEGSSIFGGPVTLRVIENEGQCREFIKTIPEDGSRIEWGPVYLHARPVSTAKQQQAASGISETPSTPTTTTGAITADGSTAVVGGGNPSSSGAFTNDYLHKGGYQALELIRITNVTPLLWVRVDPHGLYNGRLNICQQDACLAEQLFHDGDAASQVEAIRALAERPLKVQGTLKITNVHDVPIAELPVRVLGDCLRGSVALHCDLPHNPAVRAQAALAIAQWQNNKAPESKYVLGGSAWLGLNLLLQYFKERFYCDGMVLPVNFRRLLLHKHIAGGGAGTDTTSDGGYQYLDTLIEKDERRNAIGFADEIEIEEDEEYRVRSACVTAIASIRAQDGMTPDAVLQFLEDVLLSGDKAAVGSLLLPHEEEQLKKKQDQALDDEVPHGRRIIDPNDQEDVANLPYVSLSLVADALLALCYVNVRPQSEFDPTAGRPVKVEHPILPLIELCLGWLEWDLERMRIRAQANISLTDVGDACFNTISPCAITALCHMSILKQCTTVAADKGDNFTSGTKRKPESLHMDKTATAQFYIDIFDDELVKSDAIKAAAAQAIACICCASDRNETVKKEPIGLLVSLEFMLDRILDPKTSPGLRITLALLMIDACTGKVCSLQRVGSFSNQNRLSTSGSRFMNGPLGASCGGDNGSAILQTVSDMTYPAASAVNDGARRGIRLLKDNGKDGTYSSQTIVRVAKFATKLWRTINGEGASLGSQPGRNTAGICAHDNVLRCTLVALWQSIWSRQCWQLLKAQTLHAMEGTPQYDSMGLDQVMKTTLKEKEAASLDDEALKPLAQLVDAEIDRQRWRGEMPTQAYRYFKSTADNLNLTEVGQPLPIVKKDAAWKSGGWVASTAHQRRAQGADGGSAVTKIRLMVKSSSVGETS